MSTFTRAQRKLLRELADGGCFFAALREPGDFMKDGKVFSDAVGIIVHPPGAGADRTLRYRVRNLTAGPLYLASPALVDCPEDASGQREFRITDAGSAALNARAESQAAGAEKP